MALVGLLLFFDRDSGDCTLIPSGAAILVYVVGSASESNACTAKDGEAYFPGSHSGVPPLIMLPFVGVFSPVSIQLLLLSLYRERQELTGKFFEKIGR